MPVVFKSAGPARSDLREGAGQNFSSKAADSTPHNQPFELRGPPRPEGREKRVTCKYYRPRCRVWIHRPTASVFFGGDSVGLVVRRYRQTSFEFIRDPRPRPEVHPALARPIPCNSKEEAPGLDTNRGCFISSSIGLLSIGRSSPPDQPNHLILCGLRRRFTFLGEAIMSVPWNPSSSLFVNFTIY